VGRVRQLYYEGLITRFKVMVYGTAACGLLTVIMFILINMNEMYYKWGRSEKTVEISSKFDCSNRNQLVVMVTTASS
jgi:hypothetical protein